MPRRLTTVAPRHHRRTPSTSTDRSTSAPKKPSAKPTAVAVKVRENDPTLSARVEGRQVVIRGTSSNRGIAPSTLALTFDGQEVSMRLGRGTTGSKVAQVVKSNLPRGYELKKVAAEGPGETRFEVLRRGARAWGPEREEDPHRVEVRRLDDGFSPE